MWEYMKMLEYPVNIKNPDPKMAQLIISQYGGPDGEMGAATRYLSQRYAMPYREIGGLFTDIGVSVAKLRIIDFRFTPESRTFRSFMIFE